MTWNRTVPCHPVEAADLVYVEVPKAAATSIKWALSSFRVGGPPNNDDDIHRWFGYTEASDVSQMQQWLTGRWVSMFAFTVVRHPIDRFLSFFYGIKPANDLNQYVRWLRQGMLADNIHSAPQTDIIGTDLSCFDWVGQIESMDVVDKVLSEHTSRQMVMPHRNASLEQRDLLTKGSLSRLKRLYRTDFEVLGYE